MTHQIHDVVITSHILGYMALPSGCWYQLSFDILRKMMEDRIGRASATITPRCSWDVRLHPQPRYRKQLQLDIRSWSSGVIGVDWSAAFLYFGLLRIDFIRTAFLFKDPITPHEAECYTSWICVHFWKYIYQLWMV